MGCRPAGLHPLHILQPLSAVSGTDYKEVNPIDVPDWDEQVLSTGSRCVFHSKAWARVLTESYHHTPAYLTRSHNQQLDCLIPLMHVESWVTGRRGVSLPFSDSCDWLVPPGELDAVLAHLHTRSKFYKWNYLEVRTTLPTSQHIIPHESFYHHELDLTASQQSLWNGLKSEVRTSIRKSASSGIEVRFTHRHSDLTEFTRLHARTRKKQGIPPQPSIFFERIFDNIIAKGLGEIGIAHREGVSHAAAIFLYFGTTAMYKYGASDPDLLPQRGNNALLWAALLNCARSGFTRLSLGRTALAHGGLRRFKTGWGCRESPLDYFRYDYQLNRFIPGRPPLLACPTGLFKHTSLPLLQLAGRLIYPHLS